MASIHIEALNCDMAPQACSVLAQAFVTNPLNIAAFGPSQLAKNEAFFRVGLAAMKGTKLVATDGPKILGLIHWVPFPDCQFPWFEKLRMVPAMVKGFGLGSALRVGSWLSTWSKHDPSTAHSHLGPIGVLPAVQGSAYRSSAHGGILQRARSNPRSWLPRDRSTQECELPSSIWF